MLSGSFVALLLKTNKKTQAASMILGPDFEIQKWLLGCQIIKKDMANSSSISAITVLSYAPKDNCLSISKCVSPRLHHLTFPVEPLFSLRHSLLHLDSNSLNGGILLSQPQLYSFQSSASVVKYAHTRCKTTFPLQNSEATLSTRVFLLLQLQLQLSLLHLLLSVL